MSAVLFFFIRQGKQRSACKSYCKLSQPSHVNTARVMHDQASRCNGKNVPLGVLTTESRCFSVGKAMLIWVHQCCLFLSYLPMLNVQCRAEQSHVWKSLFAKASPYHDPNSQFLLGDTGAVVAIKRNLQWLPLRAVATQEYHNKATFTFAVGFFFLIIRI